MSCSAKRRLIKEASFPRLLLSLVFFLRRQHKEKNIDNNLVPLFFLTGRLKITSLFVLSFLPLMSTCTPLEHDYIGLSEVSSMPTMTSPKLPPLDIKETELRLGLPGYHSLERKTHHLPPSADTLLGISQSLGRNHAAGVKRGFFDAIDGCYAKVGGTGVVKTQGCGPKVTRKDIVVAASDERTELELEKKEEDQVSERGSTAPASKAQVVGWPPIQSFRKNTMASTQPKSGDDVEGKSGAAGCLYVKVSMDGAPYLRKVDLKNYITYAELSAALEKMFSCFNIASGNCVSNEHPRGEISLEKQLADLLNDSEFVLTYEDKDGDWMLVGDVPWRMFAVSCRRLRIMKGSDAIGLAPRSGKKCKKED